MFGISSGDDNFVEKKFSPVVFLTSIEGILKLVAIVSTLSSNCCFLKITNYHLQVLIILSTSLHVLYSSCGDVPAWYPLLFPIGTGACGVVCLIFYLFYVSGLVKNHFHTWNAIDIIIATLSFVVLIAVSILTLVNCKDPRNPIEYVFSVRARVKLLK